MRERVKSERRWLAFITLEGTFANVFIVLTGGAFLTGLALMLGANHFEIGLLGAVPFLAQLAQLLSAYLIDRTGQRKRITVWGLVAGRQVWWLIIGLLYLTGTWRLEVLIGLIVISNVLVMVAAPGWLSWMADIVPEKIRGRYFGVRSAAVAISTVSAAIGGGYILDWFRDAGDEAQGFAVILGISCVFAAVAAIYLQKLPDKSPGVRKEKINWTLFLEPFRDRQFSHLLKVFFVINFAIGISAVFFAAHMLTNLDMSFTMVSLYTAVTAIVAIALNKPWGSLIDRFGSKPVMVFCLFGVSAIPMIWWLPRADFLWVLAIESVYSGSLWTGLNLAMFNIPIANSPRNRRTLYLAVFSVVTGMAYFAASILGGAMAESFADFRWQVGRQTVVNYHLVFALSALLRLLAAFMARSFKEPGEKAFPFMIQFMGYSVLRWISVGRHLFPRATRTIGALVHLPRREGPESE